jgi:hypothetical protein
MPYWHTVLFILKQHCAQGAAPFRLSLGRAQRLIGSTLVFFPYETLEELLT